MSDFAEEYVKQTEKAVVEFTKRCFPDDVMEDFRKTSEEDIKNEHNQCRVCKEKTTLRIYPDFTWMCSKCSDYAFHRGWLKGRVVFDMREENESRD